MNCGLCGKYINPNDAQRVVNPKGKLVLACKDGRMCEAPKYPPKIKTVPKGWDKKYSRPWK